MALIRGQRFLAVMREVLDKRRGFAELVLRDPGEGEPVVPVTSGLLQRLEGTGEGAC